MNAKEIKQWANLITSGHTVPDIVPDGWRTAKEIAAELKVSTDYARQILSSLCEQGIVEKKKFRAMTGRGAIPMNHYRSVPEEKKAAAEGHQQ